MGLLIDGVWREDSHDKKRMQAGRFVRPQTRFRNWITADGSAGPSGEGGFPAARSRYHLYVALSCPWAHRTLIFRRLKALEDVVSMSVVERSSMTMAGSSQRPMRQTASKIWRRSTCSPTRTSRAA